MQISEALKIFEEEKNTYLRTIKSQNNPKAILLGGQPACGKGGLVSKIEQMYPNRMFLIINGDNYRIHHPNFKELRNNEKLFSSETQILSSVFTEGLIQEAIKNRYDVIIEGTMRNPTTPYNTAKELKQNGFSVEVFCISAPALFTELGYYNRYQEERNLQGWGRLSEKKSHDDAVKGLLDSLDLLYKRKMVEKIHIFTYLGKKHIRTYVLKNNKWNIQFPSPSYTIRKTREMQLKNKELLNKIIQKGNITLNSIDFKNKEGVANVLYQLNLKFRNLEIKRGFKR